MDPKASVLPTTPQHLTSLVSYSVNVICMNDSIVFDLMQDT